MDINQLKCFVKIAEYENMSRAAEELLIAQPSLSRTIKSLEQHFHTQLFERDGKKIRISKSGEILYRHAVAVISGLEEAENEIDKINSSGSTL